jgi:hypothetical protein
MAPSLEDMGIRPIQPLHLDFMLIPYARQRAARSGEPWWQRPQHDLRGGDPEHFVFGQRLGRHFLRRTEPRLLRLPFLDAGSAYGLAWSNLAGACVKWK